MTSTALDTWTILIVSQDPAQGMILATAMTDAGAQVVGPFADADRTLAQLNMSGLPGLHRAAVLDADLTGATSEVLSRYLQHKGIPFVLVTDREGAARVPLTRDHPTLSKSTPGHAVVARLQSMLGLSD